MVAVWREELRVGARVRDWTREGDARMSSREEWVERRERVYKFSCTGVYIQLGREYVRGLFVVGGSKTLKEQNERLEGREGGQGENPETQVSVGWSKVRSVLAPWKAKGRKGKKKKGEDGGECGGVEVWSCDG